MKKEVGALVFHQYFDCKSPSYKPFHQVYDITVDLTYKARLVYDGVQVDPTGLSIRATMVNVVSVCLLGLIAYSQNLSIICGDIGNAFIQTHTKEKIYIRCGPEFGDRVDPIEIIVHALYRLTTSASFSELCWKISYAHLVSYPYILA